MIIQKNASGKKTLKLNQSEWEKIGERNGWFEKDAAVIEDIVEEKVKPAEVYMVYSLEAQNNLFNAVNFGKTLSLEQARDLAAAAGGGTIFKYQLKADGQKYGAGEMVEVVKADEEEPEEQEEQDEMESSLLDGLTNMWS